MRSCVLALTLVALAPSISASTYVVDDGGGPGVTFTSLATAVASVSPGDVLLVRPGSYAGFTLDRGLSILGDTGAEITSGILVTGLPAGERATLANLHTQWIAVSACDGAVLLEDVMVRPVTFTGAPHPAGLGVSNSLDVRARRLDVRDLPLGTTPGVRVESARLEITDSTVVGSIGRSHDSILFPAPAQSGGDGILMVGASATVHVQNSNVTGGRGGHAWSPPILFPDAGDGANGILVPSGSELLVVGAITTVVRGGDPGLGSDCPDDGYPGAGVVAMPGSTVRVSGQTFAAGAGDPTCGNPTPLPIVGAHTIPSPADPWLAFGATPSPGNLVTFTLFAEPGAQAQLGFGRAPQIFASPGTFEDSLTNPIRTFQLGTMPATGHKTVTLTLPGNYPRGTTIVAQAYVVSTGAVPQRSPSAAITLR